MSIAPADRRKRRMLIQKVDELPALPVTLMEIIKVTGNPDATANDLAQVISKDQSISSMLLRLVNSAFYGHFRSISSVSRAIVILGFQTVKSLALGASIFHSSPESRGNALDWDKFWVHSLAVAAFSKKLASKVDVMGEIDSETVFVSGLLHDVGKVVFNNYFSEEYKEVVMIARKDKKWIRTVEEDLMGIDHCGAGQYLASKWHFPPPVIEAVEFHHDPGKPENQPGTMAALTHVADFCCNQIKIGASGNEKDPELDEVAIDILELGDGKLDDVTTEIENERETIESFGIE
ncbi:MAG TPA: HDOD domain-containing protein [Nitrospirae bacterium]|nr:HDOD domain-containing protein [Nitrospirota bacterium]